MKTVKKWFATLPKELRENEVDLPDFKTDKLSAAIFLGIEDLYKSKEGFEYWDSFRKCLQWAEGDDTQLSEPLEETQMEKDFAASMLKAKNEMPIRSYRICNSSDRGGEIL